MGVKSRIIALLAKEEDILTISDIAKKLQIAYSHAHKYSIELHEKGMINQKKVGNAWVCSLNYKSPLTISNLAMMESEKAAELLKKSPHTENTLKLIETIKDSVHCVILKNNKIIIVTPERIANADFSIFRNRTVINQQQLTKNIQYYRDGVILHGAEKYWSLIT